MKKLILTLLTISVFTVSFAQKETNFEVDAFDAIEVHNAFKVYLTQGDVHTVEAHVPDGASEDLIIEVKAGTLIIAVKNKNSKSKSTWSWKNKSVTVHDQYHGNGKISNAEIYITCPNLKSIDVSGAVVLLGQNHFKINQLNIDLSGSSKVELDISGNGLDIDLSGSSSAQVKSELNQDIDIDLSGASKLVISGNCNNIEIDCSGATSVSGEFLNVSAANVETSGASSVKLGETKKLDADASGASSIKYQGAGNDNTTKVHIEKSGAASVKAY